MAKRPVFPRNSDSQTTPLHVGEDEAEDLHQAPSRQSKWSTNYIRRALYICFLILLIVLWIVVIFTFAGRERKYEIDDLERDVNNHKVQSKLKGIPDDFNVVMKGHLRKYTAEGNVLTVEWQALIVDTLHTDLDIASNLAVYQDVHTCPIQNQTLIDEWLKLIKDQNFTDVTAQDLILTEVFQPPPPPIGYVGRSKSDSVLTNINLGEPEGTNVWLHPGWGYPFDRSEGSIVLALSWNDTGAALKHQGIDLIPMAGIQLTEKILGFRVTAQSKPNCNTNGACEMSIDFVVKRPGEVRFIVILVVIINWMITISIFFLVCESVGVRRLHILKDVDIIGICLAALFALPSVRAILPAAPGFGCLVDLIGILPNVILISISATTLTIAKIFNKLDEDQPPKKIA